MSNIINFPAPTAEYDAPLGEYDAPLGEYDAPLGEYAAPLGECDAPMWEDVPQPEPRVIRVILPDPPPTNPILAVISQIIFGAALGLLAVALFA